MSNVLIAGDTHGHAMHPGYISFLKQVKRKHKCDTIVLIGDMADHETIKFHARYPNEPGPLQDYEETLKSIKLLHKAFPEAYVCIGNHDERVVRVGAAAGIPSIYLRDYEDVWETPGWEWGRSFMIDGVMYAHGTGRSSVNSAFVTACRYNHSVVHGHFHTQAGILFRNGPGPNNQIFGMQVGTGVQADHRCFQYSKNSLSRAILSCGVVKDGTQPYLELMDAR